MHLRTHEAQDAHLRHTWFVLRTTILRFSDLHDGIAALQFLPQSDRIVVLAETENKDSFTIKAEGSYQKLLKTSTAFAALIGVLVSCLVVAECLYDQTRSTRARTR